MRLPDNQDIIFDSENKLGFPEMSVYTGHVNIKDLKPADFDFLRTNYKTSLSFFNAVHFYIDDYKFQCIWNQPQRYIDFLKRFQFVISPDFSIYTDFPICVNMYNKYRNHWLYNFYQWHNINMIPNINLGCRSEWWDEFLAGYPTNSVISISDIGRSKLLEDKIFKKDYIEFIQDRLKPTQILYFTRSKDVPFVSDPIHVVYRR